jgi:hypothetical protein
MTAQTAPFAQGMTGRAGSARNFQKATADRRGGAPKQLGQARADRSTRAARRPGGRRRGGRNTPSSRSCVRILRHEPLLHFVADVLETVHATNQLADELGTTTEGLTGLQARPRAGWASTARPLTTGCAGSTRSSARWRMAAWPRPTHSAASGCPPTSSRRCRLTRPCGRSRTSLTGIADPTQRAAAAFGIFGKDAGKLLPLLAIGRRAD